MPVDLRTPALPPPLFPMPYADEDPSGTIERRIAVVGGGTDSFAITGDQARFRISLSEFGREFLARPVSSSWFDAMLEQNLFSGLIDTDGKNDARLSNRQLDAKLTRAFEDTPLEDGISHPAEQIIGEALRSGKRQHVMEQFGQLGIDADRPEFAASVLRCLGRHLPGTAAWRAGLVRSALRANDVQVRDAAAQAAESWGGPEIRQALRSHCETVPWLRAYIADILEDFEA